MLSDSGFPLFCNFFQIAAEIEDALLDFTDRQTGLLRHFADGGLVFVESLLIVDAAVIGRAEPGKHFLRLPGDDIRDGGVDVGVPDCPMFGIGEVEKFGDPDEGIVDEMEYGFHLLIGKFAVFTAEKFDDGIIPLGFAEDGRSCWP